MLHITLQLTTKTLYYKPTMLNIITLYLYKDESNNIFNIFC